MTQTRPPTAAPLRFATVGDNCIDRYLPLQKAAVGGNAVNVAVQLVLEGERCSYFGAVGKDEAGVWTHEALDLHGVGLDHLQHLDAATAYTDIDVDAAGERFIRFEDFGATALYQPSSQDIFALTKMDHVHIGWLREAEALHAALAGSGVSISQDIAVNSDASGIDIGFASVGASEPLARAALRQLQDMGCRVAVVTCGEMGSIGWDGGEVLVTGSRAVPIVNDTTGAGDTFIAGFLAAWKHGLALPDCLAAGRDAAARTCAHIGGFPQTLRLLK